MPLPVNYKYLYLNEVGKFEREFQFSVYKKGRLLKNLDNDWVNENVFHKFEAFLWEAVVDLLDDSKFLWEGNIYVFFFENSEDYLRFILTFGNSDISYDEIRTD